MEHDLQNLEEIKVAVSAGKGKALPRHHRLRAAANAVFACVLQRNSGFVQCFNNGRIREKRRQTATMPEQHIHRPGNQLAGSICIYPQDRSRLRQAGIG